jgi:hypothetical protein
MVVHPAIESTPSKAAPPVAADASPRAIILAVFMSAVQAEPPAPAQETPAEPGPIKAEPATGATRVRLSSEPAATAQSAPAVESAGPAEQLAPQSILQSAGNLLKPRPPSPEPAAPSHQTVRGTIAEIELERGFVRVLLPHQAEPPVGAHGKVYHKQLFGQTLIGELEVVSSGSGMAVTRPRAGTQLEKLSRGHHVVIAF